MIAFKTSDTDLVLFRRFVEQTDKQAINELFCRHWSWAYRVALRCAGNSEDAEDIAQTALLKVMQMAKQYQEGESARAWIAAMVKNTAYNFSLFKQICG